MRRGIFSSSDPELKLAREYPPIRKAPAESMSALSSARSRTGEMASARPGQLRTSCDDVLPMHPGFRSPSRGDPRRRYHRVAELAVDFPDQCAARSPRLPVGSYDDPLGGAGARAWVSLEQASSGLSAIRTCNSFLLAEIRVLRYCFLRIIRN